MTQTEHRTQSAAPSLVPSLAALVISALAAGWATSHIMLAEVGDTGLMLVLGLIAISFIVLVFALIAWTGVADPKRALSLWHGIGVALVAAGVGVLIVHLSAAGNGVGRGIGVIAVLLGVIALAVGLVVGRRAKAKATLAEVIMATGIQVPAVVANRGYVEFGESTQVNTPVLFHFTDAEGVDRQVEKRMLILAEDPIENGQETVLWYDPADPDDPDRIVVQLQREHPAP